MARPTRSGPSWNWRKICAIAPSAITPGAVKSATELNRLSAAPAGVPTTPARHSGSPYIARRSPPAGQALAAPALHDLPGEPALAHQTDEWCSIKRIEEAEAIYSELIVRWCGL